MLSSHRARQEERRAPGCVPPAPGHLPLAEAKHLLSPDPTTH